MCEDGSSVLVVCANGDFFVMILSFHQFSVFVGAVLFC